MPVREIAIANSPQALAFHDLGPQAEAPLLALVASAGGGELNGLYVLGRLARFLQAIESGEQAAYRLARRLLILPLGGQHTDELALAAPLLEQTRDAHYRILIGGQGGAFEHLPQVQLLDGFDDERASAFLFGLPAILEAPMHAHPLLQGWREHSGELFLIRAGRTSTLQLSHCQRLFQALINFLIRVGVLEGPEELEVEEDVHLFGPEQGLALTTEAEGMFVSNLEVGRWLQAGEHIGYLYDAFSGEIAQEFRAPRSGLLSGLCRQPLLGAGEVVAQILVR